MNIHTENFNSIGEARFKYVIKYINDHPFVKGNAFFNLGGDHTGLNIRYSNYPVNDSTTINIYRSSYIFQNKIIDKEKLSLSGIRYEGNIYYSISPAIDVSMIDHKVIPFDIFETIFFFISRIEELKLPQEAYLGNKEKFEGGLVAVKHGIHKIPVVDDLVKLLSTIITGKWENKPTVNAISHDIDIINKFSHPLVILKKIGGHFLHRKSPKGLGHLFKGYWEYMSEKKDPYDTFDWMLIDQKGIEKKTYFLSGGDHRWDTPYDQKSEYFKSIIDKVEAMGYEIGIHPSYESWDDLKLIDAEKSLLEDNIGRQIEISRQHFLNFDINITPKLLLEAGIKQDSSLGFTRHVGFRCGTGFPYFLYDFENECQSELLEDPLVFMDSSCLHECNYESEKYMDLMISFLSSNETNTRIQFNFHNSFFDEAALRGIPLKSFYLDYFSG